MSKVRKSRPRQAERPMALAVILGILSILGVSVVYAVTEMFIPGSPIRNFVDLASNDLSPTLSSSPLYQQFSNEINKQMVFEEPIAYFIGGLVLGRVVSRRYSQAQTLLAGGVMALVLNLLALAVLWGDLIATQHGHLKVGQVDAKLELTQTLLAIFWIGVCVVGVEIGLRWRRAADARAASAMSPAASPR